MRRLFVQPFYVTSSFFVVNAPYAILCGYHTICTAQRCAYMYCMCQYMCTIYISSIGQDLKLPQND